MKTKSKKKSLIDKPKELLELIDDCLKLKMEEKKKFGEVFTPFKLINEMLDKLDEYYRKSHKKSIFSVKKNENSVSIIINILQQRFLYCFKILFYHTF
jgi:hypothetical protein